MSPALAKTSDREIVAAARALIAAEGLDGLSLQKVAAAVGIRAPSLYKRFDDRAALVDAVREDLLADLAEAMEAAAADRQPAEAVVAMSQAYRAFALREAQAYPLLFGAGATPSPGALRAVAPVLDVLGKLVGADDALPAARTLTAFLHGFVTMELSGSFQFAGSVQTAFEFGLATLARGLRGV